MDKILDRYWQNIIHDTIKSNGSDVYINYFTSSACPICVIDPVSGEGRFNCTTCLGTGQWKVSTTIGVKAVINKFVGSRGFYAYSNLKTTLGFEGDARITCWLEDVQRNPFVENSKTYFDSANSVRIGSQYYAVKNVETVGMTTDTVVMVTLERK